MFIKHSMGKQTLLIYRILVGLYAAFFLLLRLPLYCLFKWPMITYDSPNYVLINIGTWYIFDRRLPVYVFFVEGITALTRGVEAIAIVQMAISFIVSMLYLIYSARYFKKHFLFHLFFIGLTYCNTYTVFFEMSLLSESLFFNLLFLFFQFQYLSFKTGLRKYWLISGVLLALLLLLKQAAVFLMPLAFIVVCWLTYKRNSKAVLNYFGPACISLLLFCFYNYLSLGLFTYSPFGGLNLVGTVSTFMSTSSTYPATTNACIGKVKNMVNEEEIAVITNSWNLTKLHTVFHKHYNDCWELHRCLAQSNNTPNHEQLVKFDNLYYDISHKAIAQNKELYFKFFLAMVVKYFIAVREIIIVDAEIAKTYAIGHEVANAFIKSQAGFAVNKMIDCTEKPDDLPIGSWWVWLNRCLFFVLGLFELSAVWVGVQFVLVFTGVVLFLRKGYLPAGIVLFMLMAMANLLNAIGTSLVEETFYRYSYPYYFTYYYSIAVLPVFYYMLKSET